MNSDGTQQERLTFTGILGIQDDDIDITGLDYNSALGLAAFAIFESIYLYDYDNNSFYTLLFDASFNEPFAQELAWGPNGALYYSDDNGVWKITDPFASSIIPTQIYSSVEGVLSLDVSINGHLAFVERVYIYEMPDGTFYFSKYGGLYSDIGPGGDNSQAIRVDQNGQSVAFNATDFNALPFLVPIEQIMIIKDETNPVTEVVTTAHGVFTLPTFDGEWITDSWNDYGTGQFAVEATVDFVAYTYWAFDLFQVFTDLERRNSIWSVEWSADGTQLAYSDLWGTQIALEYTELEPNFGMTFEFNDPTTYTTLSGSDFRVEWSYFYNVNTLEVAQAIPNAYLGDIDNPVYAYDSLDNFGVAQASWTSGGEKIFFVKGRANTQQYVRLDNTFAWTDLDIWIMDSDNLFGDGPQKQLTFDPNKDFLPVWIP